MDKLKKKDNSEDLSFIKAELASIKSELLTNNKLLLANQDKIIELLIMNKKI